MCNDVPTSARQVAEFYRKEEIEKERQRIERQFDKNVYLEMVNQLKEQNNILQKQYEESKVELEKSHKLNTKMFIVAIVSAVIAIVSLISTIVIAIIK